MVDHRDGDASPHALVAGVAVDAKRLQAASQRGASLAVGGGEPVAERAVGDADAEVSDEGRVVETPQVQGAAAGALVVFGRRLGEQRLVVVAGDDLEQLAVGGVGRQLEVEEAAGRTLRLVGGGVLAG